MHGKKPCHEVFIELGIENWDFLRGKLGEGARRGWVCVVWVRGFGIDVVKLDMYILTGSEKEKVG